MRWLILFISLLSISLTADELTVEFYPPYPMKGDAVSVVVKSDVPIGLVDNIPQVKDWRAGGGIRRGSQTINGDSSYYFILQYVPEKEGEFTYPSFKVNVNGKITKTPEKKITILPNKSTDEKDKIILTGITYNGSDKLPEKIYPGVIFTIDYKVSVVRGWRYLDHDVLYDYRPQLKADNMHVIVHNGFMENRNFEEITEHSIHDGIPYTTKVYRYKLAPMKSGKYDFKINQRIYALKKLPGIPRNQTHEKEISINETLNVVPIPPAPQAVYFLEIAGDWKVDAKLSKSTVKTGHTFELTLFVKGSNGDVERIKAPELKLPGFEVDPKPEIQHHSQGAIIKYSMRALRKADFPKIVFATFDHKTESFTKHPVNLDIDISGKDIVVDPKPVKSSDLLSNNETDTPTLMTGESGLSRPLYYNISPLWYLISLLLPLSYFLTVWFYRRAEMGESNVDVKKEAVKKLQTLCIKLENSSDSEIIEKELLPCLAKACGLPPGATADELAVKLDDKELAEMIRNSSHQSFLPGNQQLSNNSLLASKLKKTLLALMVFLFSVSLSANEEMSIKSYENGDFYAAAKGFSELIKQDNANPNFHYNLGLSLNEMEKYPEALASFETASRLAPANNAIRRQVISLRNKLQVQKANDLFSVRDKLRPDQWLKVSMIVWSLFWLALVVQLISKTPGKRWTAIAGGIVTFFCLLAWFTQLSSTYKEGQYIITEKVTIDETDFKAGEEILAVSETDQKVSFKIKGKEVSLDKGKLTKVW